MIRDIEPRDYSRILEIYNYYITDTTVSFEEEALSLSAFSARIDRIREEYPFIVLEEDGEVIGYAYLDRFHERSAYRYTADLSLYLSKDKRGKGRGAALLFEIENRGRSQGIENIISLVTEENSHSIAFHQKYGFTFVGKMERVGEKFGRKIGVIYYQKGL